MISGLVIGIFVYLGLWNLSIDLKYRCDEIIDLLEEQNDKLHKWNDGNGGGK